MSISNNIRRLNLRVIYIAGLYHSGSTLLDLLLGNLDNVIGLGEIYKGFQDGLESKCSCGKFVENCKFWHPNLNLFEPSNHHDIKKKYDIILSSFEKQLGSTKILVDSSKCKPFYYFFSNDDYFNGLPYYTKNKNVELQVIHLIRDVRSWSYGLYLRDQKELKNAHGLNFLFLKFKSIFRTKFIRCIQWYISHKRIKSYLKSNGISSVCVSYEELAMHPEETLKSICSDLNLSFKKKSISIENSKSHIAVGNPMRNNSNKNKKISYDIRWIKNSHVNLNFPVLSKLIMKFNKENVYTR